MLYSKNKKLNYRTAFLSGNDFFKNWKHEKYKLGKKGKIFNFRNKQMAGAKVFSIFLEYVLKEIIKGKHWNIGVLKAKRGGGYIQIRLQKVSQEQLGYMKDMPFLETYDWFSSGGNYYRPVLIHTNHKSYPMYYGISMPRYLEELNNEICNDPFYERDIGNVRFAPIWREMEEYLDGYVGRDVIVSCSRYGQRWLLHLMAEVVGLILDRREIFNSDTGFTFYPMDRGLHMMTNELVGASARGKGKFLGDEVKWYWCPTAQFKRRGKVYAYIYPSERIAVAMHYYKSRVTEAPKEMTKQLIRHYRNYYDTRTSKFRYSEKVLVPQDLIRI